jgi:hypothetical protein
LELVYRCLRRGLILRVERLELLYEAKRGCPSLYCLIPLLAYH